MNRILELWQGLEQRERTTICAGSLLVLLTAVYLLFDGLWTQRAALLQDRNALLAEASWMQEQAELAEQLVNACPESQLMPLPPDELIDLLATRSRLNVQNMNRNGSTYAMQLRAGDGNSILQFIHLSACRGFSLSAVQIQQDAASSAYLGNVEFRYEG
jgi:type II secretory pathway component PulM